MVRMNRNKEIQTSASKECSSAQEVERLAVCIPVSATVSLGKTLYQHGSVRVRLDVRWWWEGRVGACWCLLAATLPSLPQACTCSSPPLCEWIVIPMRSVFAALETPPSNLNQLTHSVYASLSPLGFDPRVELQKCTSEEKKTGSAISPRNNIAPARTRRKYFK